MSQVNIILQVKDIERALYDAYQVHPTVFCLPVKVNSYTLSNDVHCWSPANLTHDSTLLSTSRQRGTEGPITPEEFENAGLFLWLTSTLIRYFNGPFRKRSSNWRNLRTPAFVFVWTEYIGLACCVGGWLGHKTNQYTSSDSLFSSVVFLSLYRRSCLFFNAPFWCGGIWREDTGAGEGRKVENFF